MGLCPSGGFAAFTVLGGDGKAVLERGLVRFEVFRRGLGDRDRFEAGPDDCAGSGKLPGTLQFLRLTSRRDVRE
jgi:hypothetical protein